MSFFRLLAVTIGVAALSGLFGACVGGLLGYAVPSSLSMFFGSEGGKDGKATTDGINRKVELGIDSQKNMAGQGMALGGAFGLVVGAVLGFILGIVDQVLLLVRGIFHARSTVGSTAGSRVEGFKGSMVEPKRNLETVGH